MEPPTPESEFARSLMDNAVTHFDLSTYQYVEHLPIICACCVLMSSWAACTVTRAWLTGLRLLNVPGHLEAPVGTADTLHATGLACFCSKRLSPLS